jgi:zinc/manganese transport system permease protein
MNTVPILGLPLLAALEMAAILGYLGIHVIKREVIFIDIALAQIAAAGAIAAHIAFGAHQNSVVGYSSALAATMGAAAFYSLARKRIREIPLEAVIGVTYALAAALALFLVGVSPGGHVHVHEMLAGSILWATRGDILLCGMVFALAGLALYAFRKPLARISEDYHTAARAGVHTAAWDFLFYAILGVVITLAVRIAGVVIVFSFLIIPATLSALFSNGWRERLLTTWIMAGAASGLGLLFADRFDFSVGPAVALFLGAGLVVTATLRQLGLTKRATAVTSLGLAVALFVWLLWMTGASRPASVSTPVACIRVPLGDRRRVPQRAAPPGPPAMEVRFRKAREDCRAGAPPCGTRTPMNRRQDPRDRA